MSDEWFTDIEEPSSDYLKSSDLYNRAVLVRPTTHGSDVNKEDGEPYTFWNCDAVILNAAGVENHGEVRIAWKLIQKGLANRAGKWILAKAVPKGNAWVLDPGAVDPKIKAAVPGLKAEVEALFAPPAAAAPPAYEDGSEPF